jgi:hypothetical protein
MDRFLLQRGAIPHDKSISGVKIHRARFLKLRIIKNGHTDGKNDGILKVPPNDVLVRGAKS